MTTCRRPAAITASISAFPGCLRQGTQHGNNGFQAVSKALVNELSFLHRNSIDATTDARISLESRGQREELLLWCGDVSCASHPGLLSLPLKLPTPLEPPGAGHRKCFPPCPCPQVSSCLLCRWDSRGRHIFIKCPTQGPVCIKPSSGWQRTAALTLCLPRPTSADACA